MAAPPRPFLTEEEIKGLSPSERAVAIAEWSSFNARLRREREQQASRGPFRGGRARGGRGRGRGYYGGHTYAPYPIVSYSQPAFHNRSATFNQSNSPTVANGTPTHSASVKQETSITLIKTPCPAFTATGVCKRHRCPHIHNPDKTAICKQFLFKGECPKGSSCPLSHEPSSNRSPNCIHFQNGSCNKDDCRYSHIHVNENAPVCDAFARLGFCEKGDQCADRHAFECPDFTNKGSCEDKGCRLPHVVHAGRLRKARMSSSEAESPTNPSSPVVKGEDPVDNIDYAHALTQQVDFVPFES